MRAANPIPRILLAICVAVLAWPTAAVSSDSAPPPQAEAEGLDAKTEEEVQRAVFRAISTGNLLRLEALLEAYPQGASLGSWDGVMPMHAAAARGNVRAAEMLLDAGADTALRDDHGRTPLDEAMRAGHTQVVRFFLQRGVELGGPEPGTGWTPLHRAAAADMPELIRFLGSKLPLDTADLEGRTPLHLAAEIGCPDSAAVLIEVGADPNVAGPQGKRPLHLAVEHGHDEVLRTLLEQGADPLERDDSGKAPAHAAVQQNDVSAIRVLGTHADGLLATMPDGASPLHLAVLNGNASTIQTLLAAVPDSPRDDAGKTPLHLAVERRPRQFVELFIQAGAEVNAADNAGETPLHVACRNSRPGIVAILCDAGADIAKKDKEGMTPLHKAAQARSPQTCRVLLDRGAAVDKRATNGDTPLHAAVRASSRTAAQLLIDAGAGLDAQNELGQTPLHLASANGQPLLTRLLVDAGASVSVKNRAGQTPLDIAKARDFEAVAAALETAPSETKPGDKPESKIE